MLFLPTRSLFNYNSLSGLKGTLHYIAAEPSLHGTLKHSTQLNLQVLATDGLTLLLISTTVELYLLSLGSHDVQLVHFWLQGFILDPKVLLRSCISHFDKIIFHL